MSENNNAVGDVRNVAKKELLSEITKFSLFVVVGLQMLIIWGLMTSEGWVLESMKVVLSVMYIIIMVGTVYRLVDWEKLAARLAD